MVAKGEGDMGVTDWEFRVTRCKLLHIEWIKNKSNYITGNYIQYPKIIHNENACKKVCMYN